MCNVYKIKFAFYFQEAFVQRTHISSQLITEYTFAQTSGSTTPSPDGTPETLSDDEIGRDNTADFTEALPSGDDRVTRELDNVLASLDTPDNIRDEMNTGVVA